MPPLKRFATGDFAPADRLDHWHNALDEIGFRTSFRNFGPQFAADFSVRAFGPLVLGDFRTSRADVYRTNRDIAQCSTHSVLIFQQLGPQGSLFGTGTMDETFLAAGDIALAYTDAPFGSRNPNPFHHRVAAIPRELLDISQAGMGRIEDGLVLRAGSPMARLLAAYMGEVRDCGALLPAASLDGVARAMGDLVAAAAGGTGGAFTEGGELALVRRRISRHLRNPALSPSGIAAECGMSLRKLHGLFEGTGETFGSHVRKARLELARASLIDGRRRVGIADLAMSLGFNSIATFYRVYRDAYGEAPGDTREGAMRGNAFE
ncbi:MAG: helix-turn-helix transcriptional regulator [Sphingomonas sp.]